jgi:hypothetical protein
MARSSLTDVSLSINDDNGGVLWSFVKGEQQESEVTLGFLTDLTGFVLEAVIIEALNEPGSDAVPSAIRPSGVQTTLTVRVPAGVQNKVYIQFPSALGSTWLVQPTPDTKVYGFFELRVSEPGGTFPKTWKPLRGLVALSYSPTDEVP